MAEQRKFELREGRGSVFMNDKGDNDKRPDMKGDGLYYGIQSWISVWKNKTKDGETWLSISVQERTS